MQVMQELDIKYCKGYNVLRFLSNTPDDDSPESKHVALNISSNVLTEDL